MVRGSRAISAVSNPIDEIQIMSLPGQWAVVSDQNRWVGLRTKAVAEVCVKTSLYRPMSGFCSPQSTAVICVLWDGGA